MNMAKIYTHKMHKLLRSLIGLCDSKRLSEEGAVPKDSVSKAGTIKRTKS